MPRVRPTPLRTPRGVSPAVAAVRTQADADALVERIRADGAPLVEPDPDDSDLVLATFVWQGRVESGCVALDATGLTDRDWFADSILDPVAGTDLRAVTLRVPRRWRGVYGFAVGVDPAPPDADAGTADRRTWWLSLMERSGPDPLAATPVRPTSWGASRSEAAMPDAPPQRWWEAGAALADDGEPIDEPEEHRLALAGVERRIWLLAPGDHGDIPRSLVVAFDGATWVEHQPVAASLAALDRSGAVPPFAVVFVDSVEAGLRSTELTASEPFRQAVVDQWVPWVEAQLPIAADPGLRIAAGQSFGGLAAVDLALAAPHAFGAAIAQSPSFWWPTDDGADGHRRYWQRRLDDGPGRPRLWLEAGLYEGDMHAHAQWFAAAARAEGLDVAHREFAGAHDPTHWREGLVEGIAALLGDAVGPRRPSEDAAGR